MTNELKERGKKGQHIFENVNLSNVFGVRPKKKKSHFKMPFVANSVACQAQSGSRIGVARKALMGRRFFRAGIRPKAALSSSCPTRPLPASPLPQQQDVSAFLPLFFCPSWERVRRREG